MVPKRKAPENGPPSKRVASSVSTPRSIDSDDDYTEDTLGENLGGDDRDMDMAIRNYTKKHDPKSYYQSESKSGMFGERDFSNVQLKPDHTTRPIWINPQSKKLILESFSPSFKSAERFLVNIASPISRVTHMHEYGLTPHSLFAAVSVGLRTRDILDQLSMFSKTEIPRAVKQFIVDSTKSFGKARLVLKNNAYQVESADPEVLQTLLRDGVVKSCVVEQSGADIATAKAAKMGGLVIPGTKMAAGVQQALEQPKKNPSDEDDDEDEGPRPPNAEDMTAKLLEDDDDDDQGDDVHSFQIDNNKVKEVQKRCMEIDLPLTEEYDFRNDHRNPDLIIDLKPGAVIRPYQEQALFKMFSNGRARSGIIVLPCGAGKTLVGITAACTVKKGIIVLCTSAMSVEQWKKEFLKWSNINADDIATFTADKKDVFRGSTGIIVSTYSMVAQSTKRAHDSEKVMNFIRSKEWGLMILDEVHVVPAEMFKKVTYSVQSHSKLGLTATLLREDDKIDDLNFLIGPKLFEANWQELSDQGHIARVQCAEVWCPMTPEFYSEYLGTKLTQKQALLFTMNPRKFQACQFLIDYHERRGDKVIVFSDNVYALESYAKKLGKAYIYGGTPQNERMQILENFQYNDGVNTIFLSKIGDTSLDLPEATCLIQISSHYGSRRQEAQRLGRILRAKRRNDEGFNAFFYSLVSKDTMEMYYSSKRQAFLVDQGYAFKVITHLQGIQELPGLAFQTQQERRELLTDVLLQGADAGEAEKIDGDLFSEGRPGRKRKNGVKRSAGILSDLAGGQDMAYVEYNRSKNKEIKAKTKGNDFIRKMKREQARRAAQSKS